MLSFESDYIQGAHPEILNKLVKTNLEPLTGYGFDKYCESAKAKIKAECGREDAEIFLLSGGTQTNQLVIDTMLAPYEGVICADSGHVFSHEAGAIEFTGHKVITLKNEYGKINAEQIINYMSVFNADENHEHTVFPGMVYISHPTEYGTLYSLEELNALSNVCKDYGLKLYLDGARLGYGLMSCGTDVTLKDIADICDVFYIGGTKVGALCGEAVVFTHNNAPRHFFTQIKQHGALLAKGRLLGVQFDTLFTDGLYYRISKHAIDMADMMRRAFIEKGYEFFIETVTNQIFVTLTDDKYSKLKEEVAVGFWEKLSDSKTVVRFASSWATTKEDVDALINIL
ncbi:MAG: low specificity L-threonine aldolase [Ruminococcus sp.]|nr:low specificity L-threonine aldolase [Ruminococcus sp.]